MKQVLAILAAAALGAGLTFGLLSLDRDQVATGSDAAAQEEIGRLQSELKAAKARAGRVETITIPAEAPEPEILDPDPPIGITPHIAALKTLDPKEERVRRQAIYHLEAIAAAGDDALPAISEFFAEQVDLDFNPSEPPRKEPANDDERRAEEWRRRMRGRIPGLPTLNRTFPATLRLGLIETTMNIGGSPAEHVLPFDWFIVSVRRHTRPLFVFWVCPSIASVGLNDSAHFGVAWLIVRRR